MLAGNLREIKREFGRDRLVLSSLREEPGELAELLENNFSDLLDVDKVQKDRAIIRSKEATSKSDILLRLIEKKCRYRIFWII